MRVVVPSIKILSDINEAAMMKKIELAGRVCYKSELKITDDSAESFITNIIKHGHESVIEHEIVSVLVITDRGVSHEIVRHRLASYSQESTRYCNYGDQHIQFILPPWFSEDTKRCLLDNEIMQKWDGVANIPFFSVAENIWCKTMFRAERCYKGLIEEGWSPQEARSVLPNSLKTEIMMTMNLREWRHFLKLRMSKTAHPQIREVAFLIFKELRKELPVIFQDLEY